MTTMGWFRPAGMAAGLASCGLLLSCAQTGSFVQQAQDVAADIVLPVEQEEELGRQLSREFEREVRIHPDAQLQAYVDRVGAAVARQVRDRPEGLELDFTVIDDDEVVNAVTLPGGHIYVYSGLLRALDDEAELAGVLAHEVAHAAERHVAERMATVYGVQLLQSIALGQADGTVASIAAQLASTGALLAYSRGQEREADVMGLNYLTRAGYDPMGLVRFFEELEEGAGPRQLAFLQTHPHPEERHERLQALLAVRDDLPERTDRAEYQAIKRRL